MLKRNLKLVNLSRNAGGAIPIAVNEPILAFAPGSPERDSLRAELARVEATCKDIPIVIGGQEIRNDNVKYQVSPYNHSQKIAKYYWADKDLLHKAANAAVAAQHEWEHRPLRDRAQIFLKAADLLAGPRRSEILATTMAGQAKNVLQAEIDAACELIDFFTFNVQSALELEQSQPLSPDVGITNKIHYRAREGFVAAISPFNFTAIGGNLAGTPAMMGNPTLWKPSDTAILSNYLVYEILRECGLPDNIIQFVPADGPVFGEAICSHPYLSMVNFTGSVATFQHINMEVAKNLPGFRTFPAMIGECGGKNYHFVHNSADVRHVAVGTIRSSFEYGGQKCSACSRAYFPASKWEAIKSELLSIHSQLTMGEVSDFSIFLSAVIDEKSFDRISNYIDTAKADPSCTIIAGGNCDKSKGYFVEPTIILTTDPNFVTLKEEIFGPVLTVYVYDDDKMDETIEQMAESTQFALTGAIYCEQESLVQDLTMRLRQTAGNFYINDKSTGSVVGQQWFGGARKSGTNDKAGGPLYTSRFVSPQAIKRTHVHIHDWGYPSMTEK